jgi:hypothetical protein
MLFQVYGDGALMQWVGVLAVLVGLILFNEFARRTKFGGIIMFFVLPLLITAYLVIIQFVDVTKLPSFAQDTIYEMNGWFHYAKLYASLAGCIGFMMIKYKWGVGKQHWFKCFPFVIVAINILIAVCSDYESAINGFKAGGMAGGYWLSSESVWLYGGWHNILNGTAGILNILCMTGWWGVYSSKDKNKQDMLWPDMIWYYILAYDVWNFAYTYNCLPTHSWYCGIALLLAPTIAAFAWNRGGWIQNRANTLAIWCMFAQIFPAFQNHSAFSVIPTLYPAGSKIGDVQGVYDSTVGAVVAGTAPATANWLPMMIISILAFGINAYVVAVVFTRARLLHKNPYTNEIFTDTKDFQKAMARAEELPADSKA